MDHGRFDRLAQWFATPATRRAGIGGSLGGFAALLLGRANAAGGKERAARRQPPAGGPWPAGPCGPTATDNRCSKNKECCTGYCKPGKPGRTGRCRCIKPGKRCTGQQTCCGLATCLDGRCTRLRCTVCEKGCPFASVNEAYAAAASGARITIAPGTWTAGIVIDKDITLAGCIDGLETILQPDPDALSPNQDRFLIADNLAIPSPYSMTLENLTLRGHGPDANETLITIYSPDPASFTIRNVTARNAYAFMYVYGGNHVLEDVDIAGVTDGITQTYNLNGNDAASGSFSATRCSISSTSVAFHLIGLARDDRANAPVTLTDCTFTATEDSGVYLEGGVTTLTGCTISGCGDVGLFLGQGNATVHDTTITGNTGLYTGGIYVTTYDLATHVDLALTGTSSVTGNTVSDPARFGGIVVEWNSTTIFSVTGTSLANVHDNGGAGQCGIFDPNIFDYIEETDCDYTN